MDKEEHIPAKEQSAPEKAEPPVQTAPETPVPEEPKPTQSKDKDPEKMSKSDWIMAAATIVIAFGTLVSAGAISFQWYEMHTGGKDTTAIAEASNRNADAAQQFADAADDIDGSMDDAVKKLDAQAQAIEKSRKTSEANSRAALDATISQSRLDERAWLGFGSPSLKVNITDPIHAEIRVEVFGKSPAIGVTTRLGLTPLPAGHLLQTRDLILEKHEIPNGTVFPSETFPLKEDSTDTIEHQHDIASAVVEKRTAILYFFGETTYKDIFAVNHWTHFCVAITSGDANVAAPCAIYNDSDADSTKQKPQHPN